LGFPRQLWPICRECDQPLALLAQLPHQPPVLDMGDPKWVLHLFQCTTSSCSTWSYDTGCNAALILPREALTEGLTHPPAATAPRPTIAWAGSNRIPIADPSMHGEIWITGWREHEDGIPDHLITAYYDRTEFDALPENLRFPHNFDSRLATKTGGVPYWTGNGTPPDIPQAPFEYLMQIDSYLVLRGPLPSPSVGCDVHFIDVHKMETLAVPEADRRENAPWHISQEVGAEDEYSAAFANFGSDGTAYVFIDRETSPPDVVLFWNR
jgi:hypothetical protein